MQELIRTNLKPSRSQHVNQLVLEPICRGNSSADLRFMRCSMPALLRAAPRNVGRWSSPGCCVLQVKAGRPDRSHAVQPRCLGRIVSLALCRLPSRTTSDTEQRWLQWSGSVDVSPALAQLRGMPYEIWRSRYARSGWSTRIRIWVVAGIESPSSIKPPVTPA